MKYEVRLHRNVHKNLELLPQKVRERVHFLIELLRERGPTGPHRWLNYGKLHGFDNEWHCHISNNHAYVACWRIKKEILTIEVYYVGSHQKAPY